MSPWKPLLSSLLWEFCICTVAHRSLHEQGSKSVMWLQVSKIRFPANSLWAVSQKPLGKSHEIGKNKKSGQKGMTRSWFKSLRNFSKPSKKEKKTNHEEEEHRTMLASILPHRLSRFVGVRSPGCSCSSWFCGWDLGPTQNMTALAGGGILISTVKARPVAEGPCLGN